MVAHRRFGLSEWSLISIVCFVAVTFARENMFGRGVMHDAGEYNRIFIIGAKDCSPLDIRETFEQYGEIMDVYIPRAKSSHDSKGQYSSQM